EDGSVWAKYVVDTGGMATEDLIVEDLTGDGKPDIVAGGRATHNVKLYVQQP
ncbi:MAG TPA: VCBS repeat-containing protein, partial [Planctomycetes bacterium]|nr:VCBS repeat-containing protein [Planctomycetota bacterium]